MDDEVIPGMNKGHEEMAQKISLAAAQCYHTPEATEADVVNSWLKRPPRSQRA